ncbi:MAG: hypothetical protein CR972_03285 [Candidatus Moraniibacteriota bacterium]|nr:MAG: hypothetical protein CR972_03285 [Candidatus Moranbacteria bacterium]
MGKIKKIIKKLLQYKIIYLCLVIFFAIGVFLRVYHFSSWLHFELDQARDVFVIYDAVHGGIDDMPLHGPQARGRELYLGPIFYYFQYGSALLFGVSPESAALPDLLFSILAMPLFYAFACLFFARPISVLLTGLVSVSLFLVVYGRFAWNPNALFFWSLVTFYALLRAWDGVQLDKRWFVGAVGALAVVTQLHFIAFIVVPLTFGVYMIVVRMKVPFRAVLASCAVCLVLYLPLIVHDIKHSGQNMTAFIASVTMSENDSAQAQTASDKKHHMTERFFRAAQETSTFFATIVSADHHGRYHIRTKNDDGHITFVCDKKCKNALPYHIGAIGACVFVIGVFYITCVRMWRRGVTANADDVQKRNRYTLVCLWTGFAGVFFVLVAYQISPRFYLFVAVPFFIMCGALIESLWKWKRYGPWVSGGIVGCLIIANLVVCAQYFGVLQRAQYEVVSWRDTAMNRHDIVTLGQLRRAAPYISGDDMHNPFVIVGDNRYARALYYLVHVEKENARAQCYMKRGGFDVKNVEGIPYYLLVRTKSKTHVTDDMRLHHTIANHTQFGTITIYKMMPHGPSPLLSAQPTHCFVR